MFKAKPTKSPLECFSEPSGPFPETFYNDPNKSPLEFQLGNGKKSGASDRAIVDAVRMTSRKNKVKAMCSIPFRRPSARCHSFSSLFTAST
jgi:hypothetical protein